MFEYSSKFRISPELNGVIKEKQFLNSEVTRIYRTDKLENKRDKQKMHQNMIRRNFLLNRKEQLTPLPSHILPRLNKSKVLPNILKEFHLSSDKMDFNKDKENSFFNFKNFSDLRSKEKESEHKMDNSQKSKKLYTQYCKFNLSKPVFFKKTNNEFKSKLISNQKYDSKSLYQFKIDHPVNKRV